MVSSLDKLTRKLKNNLLDFETKANRAGREQIANAKNNNNMVNIN